MLTEKKYKSHAHCKWGALVTTHLEVHRWLVSMQNLSYYLIFQWQSIVDSLYYFTSCCFIVHWLSYFTRIKYMTLGIKLIQNNDSNRHSKYVWGLLQVTITHNLVLNPFYCFHFNVLVLLDLVYLVNVTD